jgi:hypothetical protein
MPISNPSSSSGVGATVETTELSFGTWELVDETTISSATQTWDSSTVAGDTDVSYKVVVRIINDTGNTIGYLIRLNGANWAGSRQSLTANGSSVSAGRDTTMTICQTDTNGIVAAVEVLICGVTGDKRNAYSISSERDTSSYQRGYLGFFNITTPNTATEITSIGVGADTANGIGVGSQIQVWRRVG